MHTMTRSVATSEIAFVSAIFAVLAAPVLFFMYIAGGGEFFFRECHRIPIREWRYTSDCWDASWALMVGTPVLVGLALLFILVGWFSRMERGDEPDA